jgi:hypothetical protein
MSALTNGHDWTRKQALQGTARTLPEEGMRDVAHQLGWWFRCRDCAALLLGAALGRDRGALALHLRTLEKLLEYLVAR